MQVESRRGRQFLRLVARQFMFWRALAGLPAQAGLLLVSLAACSPIGMGIGAAATVADMAMQERGLVKAAGDDVIWADINRRLLEHSVALASLVQVQVHEGRVLLSGRVEEREQRLAAIRAAWAAPWVRSVRNEILIGHPRELPQMALDEWLIGRLRTKIFIDREIRANNYSIECIDGVIYLVGVAQDQTELERAIDHARDIAYVKGVVSEVRLKGAPLPPVPANPPPVESAALAPRPTSGAKSP